jgi:U3 small nucleolar RNA-associated protein 7
MAKTDAESGKKSYNMQKPKRKHEGQSSKDGDEPAERLGQRPSKLSKGKQRKMTESEKLLLKKSVKYQRGERNTTKGITDKKLKSSILNEEKRYESAALEATRAELLLTEEAGYLEASGMEKTYKYTQAEIAKHVDVNTSSKMFSLKLDTFGPYMLDYTRSGRHLALAGAKGHIALVDAYEQDLITEFNVRETIRDIHWLHNESMFAVAQKKYVYIYDNSGMEIHCLRDHSHVNRMEYLPYHFLLAMVGRAGMLHYRDTSTGQIVATHKTKLGPCDCLRQNSRNGIMNLGHANGCVTMWSPNVSTPLVKMLCHKGPVRALDVDKGGNYMVTAGMDCQVKVWDLRNSYKPVHAYFSTSPVNTLSVSQRGLFAVGFNCHVQVWADAISTKAQSPYMTHHVPGHVVTGLQFQPFEDFLGMTHDEGIESIVVPGSGEPNIDTFEANPYQNKKQRRESEVQSLLEKLRPDMITLDETGVIGNVLREPIDNEDIAGNQKVRGHFSLCCALIQLIHLHFCGFSPYSALSLPA